MKYFHNHGSGINIEKAQPSLIRKQATQMTTVATKMDTVAGMLQKVSTTGNWESPSGDTFAAKVRDTPRNLFTIAKRLRGAAEIIRPYADQLAASQKALSAWDTKAHTASTTMKAKDKELDELSSEDPARVRVQKERGEAATELGRAERGFEKEVKEAEADEDRMAGKLYDLCEKDSDPIGYDYLEWMTNFGEGAGNAGIIAKPVALAGVAKPLGMAGRRVFYDEGSYGDVAKAGAGYGMDTVGFGASRVVKGAKQRFYGKKVNRVSGLESNPVRIRDNPLVKPTSPTASTHRATRRTTAGNGPPPKKYYDPTPSRVPVGVRDVARRKSGMDDLAGAFADWEVIAGEGRIAKVAVVVEHSAKHGNRARKTTKGAADRLNGSGVTQKAKEQEEAKRSREARAKRLADEKVSADPVEK